MNNRLIGIIRFANREFQEFIDEVAEDGAKITDTRGAGRRLEKVAQRLRQVDGLLAQEGKPYVAGAGSGDEILKYRENLTALKGVLETLQNSLLVKKSRLENARGSVQAASAWAQLLRQTS